MKATLDQEGASLNDLLQWNGTAWVPFTWDLSAVSAAANTDNAPDTAFVASSNGNSIGANSKWVKLTIDGSDYFVPAWPSTAGA